MREKAVREKRRILSSVAKGHQLHAFFHLLLLSIDLCNFAEDYFRKEV